MQEILKDSKPNPLASANFLSRCIFWWLNPLLSKGQTQNLEEEDMFNVMPQDDTEYCCDKLEREWQKELLKKKDGKKPKLIKAVLRTYGKEYLFWGIFVFIEEFCKLAQPLFLGGLVRYFSLNSGVSTEHAYMYAAGITLSSAFVAIFHHPYFYYIQVIGMHLRIACCSLIYKKSLKLSNASFSKTTTGQIVNLITNDVVRFDQAPLFLHYLWIGPIQAIVVLVFLWYQLGPSSLAGFAVLILLIPVQGSMGRLFSSLRQKTAVRTDERVRVMHEILNGIRVIKMYCWENMFADLVYKVRGEEITRIRKSNNARASILSPFFASAKLIVLTTIVSYVLTGNSISADKAFTLIAIVNPVRLSLTLFFPLAISLIAEAKVSFLRIQKFLLLEELTDNKAVSHQSCEDKSECRITGLGVTAKWDEHAEESNMIKKNTLSGVNFDVKSGELLAVIGPVGAGKSSLLMTILGELQLSNGSIKVNGSIAYAAQQPWIFSASIRQNITFGKKFDAVRYRAVLKTADLKRDLMQFPQGDQTLVGERGVSLSGGQKARVSLARALYQDADIYLLDDPLSAVDAAVGKHLFESCINGYLKKKPRILVTHQLQFLEKADRILILKDGSVYGVGTYEELASNGVDFSVLLEMDSTEEAKDICSLDDYLEEEEDQFFEYDEKKPLKEEAFKTSGMGYLSKSYDPNSILSESSKAVDLRSEVLRRRTMSKSLHELSPASLDISTMCSPEGIGSVMSMDSLDIKHTADFEAEIQEEEHIAQGSVGAATYLNYFWAGGGCLGIFFMLLLSILAQGSYILTDIWLSIWTNEEETYQEALKLHQALLDLGYNETNITLPTVDNTFNLSIFSVITVSVFIFGLIRALVFFGILVTATQNMHNQMFSTIIRCPIFFFDTNPIGRILNRFSKDTGLLDEILPLTMFDFIQCFLLILTSVMTVGIINPWVFIPIVPLCVLFIYIRRYFLMTSRDIKRLEGKTRSPVYSHISASLHGLHTIRAFEAQGVFIDEFNQHQNLHTEAWFLFLSTNRWFAIRLDSLCVVFIAVVSFACVLASTGLNGGFVGMILTYAISLMGLFQWGVRQSAEVENLMTSVERVLEYTKLPPEAALESSDDKKPPKNWPSQGSIEGVQASFKYSLTAPYVLDGLTFSIRPMEKVGIVGRTGAGKSSLIAMLFRMAEPEGLIKIDGINIKDIGLHDLRNKISIIPQDPMLFNGSVRKNMDPFGNYEDSDIWRALEEVQLKSVIEAFHSGLDAQICEGGVNLSVGQRQLLCLGRAILRQNRILVIDEATANVDARTDGLIQQTIRQKFNQCTVLTIAHRLHTIVDSDRVMVLQSGQLLEFDEPYALLQDKTSVFYSLVSQTGTAGLDNLTQIAKESSEKNKMKNYGSSEPGSIELKSTKSNIRV